jgi:hypothetical protein
VDSVPKVVNDEMVEMPEDLKRAIRRIGYADCARMIAKSESFVRGICSKGEKRIRRKDLDILEHIRMRG